jgi:LmbE family N-acetylglucosaminyl deacetylase
MKTRAGIFGVFLSLSMLLAVPAEVPEDRGAMGLSQALNRLDVVASVLHTGAHPDDENSSLLAWLSRGKGARTAYLSATRGDGGQNLLGAELFEALGVIRTEELLAARRADHAEQFFTPVYEFGFSKSSDEAFEKWGRDALLGDFVRVIRQFRPEIIVSRFRGTSADGHGHHQAAGIMTQEAFKAAADPARFPEYGRPWQAKKLYLNAGGAGQANTQAQASAPPPPVTISVNTGQFDLALGRSYSEIAAEGRSLHRSQGQGSVQNRGPSNTSLQLVQKSVDVADSADLFAGVLYKLPDLCTAGTFPQWRSQPTRTADQYSPAKGRHQQAIRPCSRPDGRPETAPADSRSFDKRARQVPARTEGGRLSGDVETRSRPGS